MVMRRIQILIVLTFLGLAAFSHAGPVLHFNGYTREAEECWRAGDRIVYQVAGRRYETPSEDVIRLDGQCASVAPGEAATSAENVTATPDPLDTVLDRPSALPPTDAVLLSGRMVLPTPTWTPRSDGCAGGRGGVSATVQRVIDGDTIAVRLPDGHREVVRYIGMNTPELHHPTRGAEPGGMEALAQNAAMLQDKQISLGFDMDTRDRYGRLLAYVYADGAFVNASLVRQGYAATATYAPNVCHAEEFRQLEREARATNAGLWGNSPATRTVIAGASDNGLSPRAEASPAPATYGTQELRTGPNVSPPHRRRTMTRRSTDPSRCEGIHGRTARS
jgi:micrococcal nuclease